MVNLFGDRGTDGGSGRPGPRGPRGPKGEPGKGGMDAMCRWIPDTVLEDFKKNETCCFQLNNLQKDLLVGRGGAYVTWISQSANKKNAVAIKPSKQVLHISKKHNALIFKESLYQVEDVMLLPFAPRYVAICVTFQTEDEQDMAIVSSCDPENIVVPFREISASSKEIRIWGANTTSTYVPVEHETKKNDWTTVFVEWSHNEGSFLVNDKEIVGSFTCQHPLGVEADDIFIGGRRDESHYLNGAISGIDIYIGDYSIPDALKNLIISHQMISNGEPPSKKKKML